MSRFVVNTVTEPGRGLIWHRDTIVVGVDKEAADKAVAALGEGWRLPTVQELFGLVEHTRSKPAIDIEAFPDTHNLAYWTSTPLASDPSCFWVVGFGYGDVDGFHRYYLACVRPVRSVPASQ